MTWVKEARAALEDGNDAKVRPIGDSMRGRIESGQLVTITPRKVDYPRASPDPAR